MQELVVTSRGKEVARILPARSADSRWATEDDAIATLRAPPWSCPSTEKRMLPVLTLPWPKRERPLSELVLAYIESDLRGRVRKGPEPLRRKRTRSANRLK